MYIATIELQIDVKYKKYEGLLSWERCWH